MLDKYYKKYGEIEPKKMLFVDPAIRRVIAPNGGAYTATGTCSYIVGNGEVAVIDPGPNDPTHLSLLLHAVKNESVSKIIITHSHLDHSESARSLQAATGAEIVGCAPHGSLGTNHPHKKMESGADWDYRPDRILNDGDSIVSENWTLTAVATPGHTSNHLAFAFKEANALFSGDHVMAWSTTLVAPPDGSMGAYMDSLQKLRTRNEHIYWPGHGGPVRNPKQYVRALIQHRRQREAAILARLEAGDTNIQQIVDRLYINLPSSLRAGAALSVLAHLERLITNGQAASDRFPASLSNRFWRV